MKHIYINANGDEHIVGFNEVWAKTKTEEQFIAEFINQDHILPDAIDKAGELRKAYNKMVPAKVAEKLAESVKISGSTPGSSVPTNEAKAGK